MHYKILVYLFWRDEELWDPYWLELGCNEIYLE